MILWFVVTRWHSPGGICNEIRRRKVGNDGENVPCSLDACTRPSFVLEHVPAMNAHTANEGGGNS